MPKTKKAALCLTVDDVHPGKSSDAYEAGGDLDKGALGHLAWLLGRHPALRITLFVTPDWREISPVPTRRLVQHVPFLRDRLFLAPVLPEGTMRLDKHPEFARYLKEMPRTEIALHGLHHVHRGPRLPVEFQDQTQVECAKLLEEAIAIFRAAGLPLTLGMTPPGWEASHALLAAMTQLGFSFVASARDILSPVAAGATAQMSGVHGVSLIYPELVGPGTMVHFTTNFQATSSIERAREIIELGGLVAIKGHIVKNGLGHIALDGIDRPYCSYLDLLFRTLEAEYGDSLWWCSMGDVAAHLADAGGVR